MMKFLMTTLMLGLLFCCCGPSALAQRKRPTKRTRPNVTLIARVDDESLTPGREADIRRLLELMSPRENFKGLVDEITGSLRKTLPPIPDQAWLDVKSMVEKEFTYDNMEKLLVPIYSKHFTAQEIKQLLVFYESPVGRKYARELPKVELDSFLVSTEFGVNLRKRILESLRSKGYNVPLA